MIEAIAHLINRDYSEIGNDFVNLDFIPRGVDTRPIVPALARVCLCMYVCYVLNIIPHI